MMPGTQQSCVYELRSHRTEGDEKDRHTGRSLASPARFERAAFRLGVRPNTVFSRFNKFTKMPESLDFFLIHCSFLPIRDQLIISVSDGSSWQKISKV